VYRHVESTADGRALFAKASDPHTQYALRVGLA
jgi:hypothetical protein